MSNMKSSTIVVVCLMIAFMAVVEAEHDNASTAEDERTAKDVQYDEHRAAMANERHDSAHKEFQERRKVLEDHGAIHMAAEPNIRPQRTASHIAALSSGGAAVASFDWLQAVLLCLIFGIPAVVSVRMLFGHVG